MTNEISTGDELELNVEQNILKNLTSGTEYNLKPLGEVLPIINSGGLFNYARSSGMI
jgi:3-isopropylmalate/(R)-2-methylmalate dehydratase small subunit